MADQGTTLLATWVTAGATLAYVVLTAWLACATWKMARASRSTLREMRRQFDALHLPSLALFVRNQHPAQDGKHPAHMTFHLQNVGGGPALYPRVWCEWAPPKIANAGRLHGDPNLDFDHAPVTCAAGDLVGRDGSAYLRLPMPPSGGMVYVEWHWTSNTEYVRRAWQIDAVAGGGVWRATRVKAPCGPSPFDDGNRRTARRRARLV